MIPPTPFLEIRAEDGRFLGMADFVSDLRSVLLPVRQPVTPMYFSAVPVFVSPETVRLEMASWSDGGRNVRHVWRVNEHDEPRLSNAARVVLAGATCETEYGKCVSFIEAMVRMAAIVNFVPNRESDGAMIPPTPDALVTKLREWSKPPQVHSAECAVFVEGDHECDCFTGKSWALMREAAEALAASPRWRPIETYEKTDLAPYVLLLFPSMSANGVRIGRWNSMWTHYKKPSPCWFLLPSGPVKLGAQPTHWQPLPLPPRPDGGTT